jgi:hypothetical protein
VLAGLAWSLRRPVTLLQAAALADRYLGLKERLSSGIQFMSQADRGGLVPSLVVDASTTAEKLDPRRAFPLRPPRDAAYLGGLAVAFVVLAFVPPLNLFMSPGEVALKAAMKREGREIERVAKESRKYADEKDLKVSREMAERLRALGKELERARLSKKEALLKAKRLSADIAQARQNLTQKGSEQALDKAAGDLQKMALKSQGAKAISEALQGQRLADAAKEMSKLADAAAKGDLSAAEQQSLASDMKAMSDALAGAGLSEMAQAMSEAAKSMESGQMQQAGDKLAESAQAAQDLQQFLQDQEQLQQMQEAMKAMEQQITQSDAPCPECGGAG